ncbi:molecular chaperone HtpG [Candidatus Gracilibacteria bacterium]|nr:MAG: molecular chaperone HtpG [Candidatus Gracilibacteria bacterium]
MTNYNFEAETGRVLELLTHSIYSNKEIFLRELISNSSDAIDKARLKSLTDVNFLGNDSEFKIFVTINKEKNTITIEDNGIGMTKEEMISHLGTIAKSGTKEFLEKLEKAKENKDHNLIGQFGVGFYSSFMVADKVEVESKSGLDEKAHKWISDGKTGYQIEESDREKRGTKITLFVNEANKELVEDWKLKELIKKYSNYVSTPIMMKAYDPRTEEEKQKEPKEMDFEQVNETKPLWKKDKKDITEEEYKSLYQSVSFDWNNPLFSLNTSVDGLVSYKSILFSPKDQNMYQNLADPNLEFGPKLYVQNVLILEHSKELLPIYLRFISGVIETNDLPLNISREMLQSNTTLEKIKKSLTKKVLAEFKKTLENKREDFEIFWKNYGKVLKEGIYYDFDLKEEIASVSLFKSLNENKFITLEEYLEKAPEKEVKCDHSSEGYDCCHNHSEEEEKNHNHCHEHKTKQKNIYYIIAKSETEALVSPFISQFKKAGVDVLILTDAIDSFWVNNLTEFKGVKLVSITNSDIELEEKTEEQKKEEEKQREDFKSFGNFVKNILGEDKIEEVVLNNNLGENIGALKTPKNGIDPQLEKMMRAMGQEVPTQKRIFELNGKNSLILEMQKEFAKDIKSEKLQDLVKYSYYQAILLEGGELKNIAEFVELTNKFAGKFLN